MPDKEEYIYGMMKNVDNFWAVVMKSDITKRNRPDQLILIYQIDDGGNYESIPNVPLSSQSTMDLMYKILKMKAK
jgi:hypothetical protein